MKKLVTIAFITLFICSLSAQTVNDVPLNEIDADYIQLFMIGKGMSGSKYKVFLDYGQELSMKTKDREILDENGNTVIFYSEAGVLNYMSDYGFKYVDIFEISMGMGGMTNVILMERRKKTKQ